MRSLEDTTQLITPSYFVTTLGEAKHLNALYNVDGDISKYEDSIPALIDSRAKVYPDVPVVGEFLPALRNSTQIDPDWGFRCFSESSFRFNALIKSMGHSI